MQAHDAGSGARMVGPEGGFSPAEQAIALAQGVLPLQMGPRILRTETAGLAALATLNAVWNDMAG